ncbi:unnamed protein product, partial [Didymodactylos carnosus]
MNTDLNPSQIYSDRP